MLQHLRSAQVGLGPEPGILEASQSGELGCDIWVPRTPCCVAMAATQREPPALSESESRTQCTVVHVLTLTVSQPPSGPPPESHPPCALLGSIDSISILPFNGKDRPSFTSWLSGAIQSLCNTRNVQRQQSQGHLNYLMK